jgi:hypothetical protein
MNPRINGVLRKSFLSFCCRIFKGLFVLDCVFANVRFRSLLRVFNRWKIRISYYIEIILQII